ncbi:MAG: hypothetical protein HY258_01595, partial [Chloroflexi bacterium]|nr:hypothetical protein [Chloroflexota bacterium]
RDTPANAWLVKIPNSADTCWILAQDASPSGSFQSLPEVTPQPSTQKLPTAPASISWPYYCTYVPGVIYSATVQLSWIDVGKNANGFRVYRKDNIIADTPADTPTYTDTTNVVVGTDLTYSVEAYNDAGVSPRTTITIHSICKQ